MVSWFSSNAGPIGVDIGSRSIKLAQFNAARTQVFDAVRWDLPAKWTDGQLVDSLRKALHGRRFRGRDAVVCLSGDDLYLQNVRVAKAPGGNLAPQVMEESRRRLPFAPENTELRYIEAADVRQGDAILREVIVMACDRAKLDNRLALIEEAGLKPVAVDTEPLAMLRCFAAQFRRDADQQERVMFVNIGANKSLVLISQGASPLFIKYVDIGGNHLDKAVASSLRMDDSAAASLRRHNGDRRAQQQEPEIRRTITTAIRPVVQRLANELSMCIRYHSVTFRGQPIKRLTLSGGEATSTLLENLQQKTDLHCEIADPMRSWPNELSLPRVCQWDVAVGLAIKEIVR